MRTKMYYFYFINALFFLVSSCKNPDPQEAFRDINIINETGIDDRHAISVFSEQYERQDVKVRKVSEPGIGLTINVRKAGDVDDPDDLTEESYSIRGEGQNTINISIIDQRGLIYALQTVYEHLFLLDTPVEDISVFHSPAFAFRTIKLNLPWNSYREHETLQLHSETMRNLEFWESFLDMMSRDRFNTLSLWSVHPWTYMIRPEKYPEACPFNDEELSEWQEFWHGLFAMAKERGIRVFMINFNIFVSPEFSKAHDVAEYSQHLDKGYNGPGDYSTLVQQYNIDVVKQVLEEYPNLTGIGVSQNERMKGPDVTEEQWQQWIVDTYFDIVTEARPEGEFIIRGHTHPAPELTRAAIENNADRLPEKVWVPLKYNWSHGHSQTKLHYIHGGSDSDIWWNPVPDRYKVIFTIRNEDFFVLRWGSHSFIRDLVDYNLPNRGVGGFIVGSETYIPARDYITRPGAHVNWNYAFERQWLFYKLWGRLMYDPELDKNVFSGYYNERYGTDQGEKLLLAYDLASQMPLKLASYYGATWDFTLYSEGFLSGYRPWRGEKWDPHSAFLSVEDIIGANPIDSSWPNVEEYVTMLEKGRHLPDSIVTPLDIANELEGSGSDALDITETIKTSNPTLQHEISDIKAWSYLSLYFSEKLKGCIDFELYRRNGEQKRKEKAVEHLTMALDHWDKVIEVTSPYFDEIPLLHFRDNFIEEEFVKPVTKFSWKNFRDQVARDIEYVRNY